MRKLAFAAALAAVLAAAGGASADDSHPSPTEPVADLATPLDPQENVRYVTGDNGVTGGHVTVEGDRLYLGSYGRGFRMYDVSEPGAPRFLGEYAPGNRADAVPDAAVFDGRHIAVLNGTRRTTFTSDTRTDRSEFLDVTDPANPVVLHTFVGQTDGEAHNGDIVDERKLWLPSGGTGTNGLRLYDLSPLLGTPAAAPENLFRGNPVDLWAASPYRGERPVGNAFTHTHDVTVYPDYEVAGLGRRDIALLAEGGSYLGSGNTGSAFVIDITDPRNPVVLLRWLHESGPGHHPIRYHHEAQFLDGDPGLMLVTDEDLHNGCEAGGVTAVRLSPDLTQATEVSEWFIGLGTPAAICSVHVFDSEGSLAYFGSYNAGLQIVDYSDPANPRKVGYYIAPGATSWGAYVHEGFVYVGDMSRGLDVFRYEGPRPDLALTAEDIEIAAGKQSATITATVRNEGGVAAASVGVRFAVDGTTIGEETISRIDAGGAAQASVVWDTKGVKGDHVITVTADPGDAIDEESEDNNSASRTVTVRGNKVRNGDFSEPGPAGWTASGDVSYDGERASAGPGGSWTSDPIDVEAGRSYSFSVAETGGNVVIEQLSALGAVLAAAPATDLVTPLDGVTQLRIRLEGGLTGATFDDVWLWEELS